MAKQTIHILVYETLSTKEVIYLAFHNKPSNYEFKALRRKLLKKYTSGRGKLICVDII